MIRRLQEPIVMHASCAVFRHAFRVALVAVAFIPVVRAEDDVVKEEQESAPAPAQQGRVFNQWQGGRVIVMPGLRLQIGGQGQVKVEGDRIEVQGGVPAPAAAEAGPRQPYLGVVTGPVTPQVRVQLDLPEGVGLSIDAVAAGGPADKAGVKQFDVIHKFNDQVVCSPEQLTVLVKVAGSGTRVPLTLVRGGRAQVVEAVLEERAADVAGEAAIVGGVPGALNWQAVVPPGLAGGLAPQLQADVERQLAEALGRTGAGVAHVQGLIPQGGAPGGAGNVRTQTQVLTIGPNAQSATVVSDARGTVEIREAGGKKTVTVKDPAGKEVHAGPLDGAEDLGKVPEEYREWVREVGGLQPARPLLPEAEESAPDAEADPEAERAEAPGGTT